MQCHRKWMVIMWTGLLGMGLFGTGLAGCQRSTESGNLPGDAEPEFAQGEGDPGDQESNDPVEVEDNDAEAGNTQAINGILSSQQVIIGGVSLAMDEAEIRAVLGEPIAVMDEESGCCGLLRQLIYPTMAIGLVQGLTPEDMGMYSLIPTRPEVETSRGIRVGSSRQAVIEAYGSPKGEVMTPLPPDDLEAPWPEDSPEYPALWYVVDYEASWLYFLLQDDEVIAIVHSSQLN